MLQKFKFEVLSAVTVAFMWFYPPWAGAIVFGSALALIGFYLYIRLETSPDVKKLKDDVKALQANVEKLVLRGK